MRRRLVLFDIDGTLLRPHGLGRRSLERAFADLYGGSGYFEGVSFHGRTDPDIVAEGLRRAGRAASETGAVVERYLAHLGEEAASSPPVALDGVREALDALRGTPGVLLGLVTGNVRRGAEIKLAREGLFGHFAVGAFGCDSVDRGELVRLARRRAAELGHAVEGPRFAYHVGDTEADVRAARAGGVSAAAVATGGESYERLAALAPDRLFRSLAPAADFVAALLA